MKVNFIVSRIDPETGGTAVCVPALASALAKRAIEVRLFTIGASVAQFPDRERSDGVQLISCRPSWPGIVAYSHELKHKLHESVNGGLHHGHGLWEFPVHYAARLCQKKGLPYLITIHGMLENWALQRSSLKKRLASTLYQNSDLRRADCLHALNMSEAISFRNYGLENPIAVVPNGVNVNDFDQISECNAIFTEMFPTTKGRRIVLFLSRLHPKRGLMHLVAAWSMISAYHTEWLLVIAGPDNQGYRSHLEEKAEGLGISDTLFFTGPLFGKDKLAALAAAKAFVLPSFSEGFSVAVLEALACRLPVLITQGCNFPELAENAAGSICSPDVQSLATGLNSLLSMSDSQRVGMGERGRRLVEQSHTWDRVAGQMVQVYEWLLGRRSIPDCVIT